MKKILIILLSLAFYYADAQKGKAFYTVSIPGMPMKDDNGNIIHPKAITGRFIILECRHTGKPTLDTILYNGILFKAEVEQKEETVTTIGIKKDNGSPVFLNRKKGSHTWKIYVYPVNGQAPPAESIKTITIKGRVGKTAFRYILTNETELTTPDRY